MIERAVILSTGDELTTGRVVDTNSSAIADRLFQSGLKWRRCSRSLTIEKNSTGPCVRDASSGM